MKIPLEFKVIGIFLLIVLSSAGIVWWMGHDDERITVEGKIIDVDIKEDTKYLDDILVVTFDNGETYYIENTLGRDVDFTVNSKFIIKLFRPDVDSYWIIEQIYRIP